MRPRLTLGKHVCLFVISKCIDKASSSIVPASDAISLQYTSSSLKGAMVGLPNGADRLDFRSRHKLRALALRHGLSWYKYANVNEGRMAPNGSLYLVTGCDKATAWAIASWCSEADEGEISLTFKTSQLIEGGVSYSYSYETYSPATVRVGPTTPSQKKNQSIFIRGFKIAVRESPLSKVMGQVSAISIVGTRPSKILPRPGGYIPFGDSQGHFSFNSDAGESHSGGSDSVSPPSQWSVLSHSRNESDHAFSDVSTMSSVPSLVRTQVTLFYHHHLMNISSLALSSFDSNQ
jgi:hypothetical protein